MASLETQHGTSGGLDAEFTGRPGEKPGSKAPQMQCSECEEPALHYSATDPVPWEPHGLHHPEWSHADGLALCAVIRDERQLRARPAQCSPFCAGPAQQARRSAGSSRRGLRARGGLKED